MIETFAKLTVYLSKNNVAGCFADTSILCSFSFPYDKYNEMAELALRPLSNAEIPIFTNVNVKAEFLENQRRVQIPECLVDFYDDLSKTLDDTLADELADFKKRYRESRPVHRKGSGTIYACIGIAYNKKRQSQVIAEHKQPFKNRLNHSTYENTGS